jgi:hypothetical protein
LSTALIAAAMLLVVIPAWADGQSSAAGPPSSVRAVATTTGSVEIEWEQVGTPGVLRYAIVRDDAPIAEVDASQSSFTDTTVVVGQRYRYAVEAIDANGVRSARSPTDRVRIPSRPETADTTPPTEPEMFEAVRLSDGSVLLDWQYATDDTDVSAFVLRRNGLRIAVLDAATLRYVDAKGSRGQAVYSLVGWDVNGLRSPVVTARVGPARSSSAPAVRGSAPGVRGSATPMAVQGAVGAAAAAAVDPALRRYPYLTDVVNSTSGTVGYATVNWATDRSATAGSARWGAVAADGTCDPANSVTATRTAVTINSLPAYQWKALLDLAPGASYCYRVYLASTDLLGGDPAPRFKTQVPVGSTEPFSFAVFGDWGAVDSSSGNPDQANLMAQIAASGVRFAVTTGDNSYPSGSQDNYGDLTNTGPNVSAVFGPQYWTVAGSSIPLFPAVGNHGLSRSDVAHPHLNIWPQDRAVATSGGRYQRDTYCCAFGTQSASLPSAWYAFDAGNVRVYVLQAAWSDSNTGTASGPYEVDAAYQWAPGTPQYQWLQADLAANPGKLKFAVFHYPLYSDQKHESSDTFLQGPASLQGLLNQYGVKLSFNGHAHIYQRNMPDAGGMVAYITGAGGAKLQSVGEDPCAANDAYAIGWSNTKGIGNACGAASPPTAPSQVFHFLKVTVAGTTVTVTPIDSTGQSFDVQTFDFGSAPGDAEPPSVPAGVVAVAASWGRVDVSWGASSDNVGVSGYEVWRDGVLVASVAGSVLGWSDVGVVASTTYGYEVRARDAAGNVSGPGVAAPVTTPPVAGVSTVTFVADADAYVAQNSANSSFGAATTLLSDGSPAMRAYLRFAVSGVTGAVTAAKVRLWVVDPTSNAPQLFGTTTGWSESTLTWNNQPGAVGSVLSDLGSVSTGTWIEYPVTTAVTGDGTYAFVLMPQSSNGLDVSSREAAAANRPQLVLTING